uniref:C2 domain-containing protein n=1 Tax=Pygocentrus nattereri TaxID=42514 RepID=A0AAR2K7R2_PYGNA
MAVGEDAGSASAETPGRHAVSVLLAFGKCLGALLPVYLAGYFGLSLCFVVLGLVVYLGWRQHRDGKQARLNTAMYVLENERDFTTTRLFRSRRDLPAWVRKGRGALLWSIQMSCRRRHMVSTPQPSRSRYKTKPACICIMFLIKRLMSVCFTKKVSQMSFLPTQLHGKLRVILEPLIGDVPLVGAVTMFFIRRPKLDINWTGLTNLLDIPCLNAMSDTMVMDAIASFLVLPNRLTVPLVADLHVAQLRSPLPRGIVRIHLVEAENLAAKDTFIKGVIAGKSDPYAVLRVGTQTFTSHHVDNNLNPQWREMYEVIVHEVPGQELEVEVFDKDPDQDDFLGRVKLDLGLVKESRVLEEWFTLKDAPSGKVHLRLEWLSLLPSAERLNEVLQKNQNLTVSSKTPDPPSAAILTVYLDQAQDLPMKKGNKDPSPMVQLSVQDTTKESRTVYGTNNPVWEDAFTFFIQDPRKQDLDIQVKDDDRSLTLGTLSIPLSRLLSSTELSMDQWFQLDNSGPASRIYMNAVLRVRLEPTSPVSPDLSVPFPGEGEDDVIKTVTHRGSDVSPTPTRPQHTSPDSSFGTEGVLRIHLVEAQDLVAKDSFMGGMVKGKSDPYVKIRVGGLTFKSRVIKENLNPVWNELYEVILTQLPGQELSHGWGQPLGAVVLPVREILAEQDLVLDRWLTLDGALPESQILIRAELKVTGQPWPAVLSLCKSSRSKLDLFWVHVMYKTATQFVFLPLFCCRNLPPCSKDGSDPYVSFLLQPDKNRSTKRKTSIKKRDLNPEFNERFDFDLSLEEATQRRLDLSVKNSVSFMSRERELIGKLHLDLNQLDLKAGIPQW